ncbi:ATP-binding protein [Streptomyces actuosus]|uniref:ATP-binding protein n=1 Tax=Streptomyces actuosus TaxID=1885 RepID=A0ABS2VJY7_STRAS|nr:ATP-binding protein [Streptomyces actuosus]MBN0043406.1 ATP-binding protein [Streptomyces actuosus]
MNQELTAAADRLPQPARPVRNFSVLLSPTPRGARLARLLAVEQLRSWELPLDPARHVVAELANNAATHGRVPGRNFRLLLYVVGAVLRVEVTDTRGDRLPPHRNAVRGGEGGHGLALVDAFADRWGVAPGLPPRKTVWAELTVPACMSPAPDGPGPGAAGGLLQGPSGRKNSHQAPPLPPAGRTHSPE